MHKAMRNADSMPTPPIASLVASKDVCLRLDINRSTLTRWVEAGVIAPVYRLPGDRGAFLFDPADVARLAKQREKLAS